MIGAMPAVAVRQQRKHVKHEDHKHRPTMLTIESNSGYVAKPPGGRRGLPTPLRSPRASPRNSPHVSPAASPKHSPVTSPRAPKHGDTQGCAHRCVHGYLCGRVSLLHVSVVCVLLGITLLVVGLVQLAPGAAHVTDRGLPAGSGINKYAIIGAGTGFLGLGFLFLILLCACQKNTHRRRRPPPHLIQAHPNHKGKTGSGRSNKGHPRSHTRQMQVHTVEGSVAAGGEGGGGGGGGGCHGERGARGHQGAGVQMRTVNEKDMSLEGFVKSPSESDALIESTCRRQ